MNESRALKKTTGIDIIRKMVKILAKELTYDHWKEKDVDYTVKKIIKWLSESIGGYIEYGTQITDDVFLPDTYIPKKEKMSKLRRVAFAIGIEKSPGEFGMINGPAITLVEMLDIIPQKWCDFSSVDVFDKNDKIFLIRFNINGTEDLLYIWSHEKNLWVRYNTEVLSKMKIHVDFDRLKNDIDLS